MSIGVTVAAALVFLPLELIASKYGNKSVTNDRRYGAFRFFATLAAGLAYMLIASTPPGWAMLGITVGFCAAGYLLGYIASICISKARSCYVGANESAGLEPGDQNFLGGDFDPDGHILNPSDMVFQ